MKEWTPPELHEFSGFGQMLSWLPVAVLLSPAATAPSSRSLSLSDETASSGSISGINYCSISIIFLKLCYVMTGIKSYFVERSPVFHSLILA
jgi:hypothetical protein